MWAWSGSGWSGLPGCAHTPSCRWTPRCLWSSSIFGFSDILNERHVVLGPSRVAAQVASGIGFIGAGTIIVRREVVKG